jgi:putative sigma-54 modulation protein
MRFIIKSKDLEISEDLKVYIEKKIGKLEKFFENINPGLIEATVEFGKAAGNQKQGEIFEARVNLTIPGKLFRLEKKMDNLYSLVDDVQDELETEIHKFKTKKETLFKRGARSIKKIYSISPLARLRKKEVKRP